jgi:hypothetical protein
MKLVSICQNCCNKCVNTSATSNIGFHGPENCSLVVKIKALGYLEAEILTKTFFTQPFCKIQDGGHIGLEANGKHCFSDCLYYKVSKNV